MRLVRRIRRIRRRRRHLEPRKLRQVTFFALSIQIVCLLVTSQLLASENEFAPQERRHWHQLPEGWNYAPDLPEGKVLVEGDMLMPEDESKRSTFESNLWPGGTVYYSFETISPDVVYSWFGSNVEFIAETAVSLPQIYDPGGSFDPDEFEVGDLVAIIGSQNNDVSLGSDYAIAASSANRIEFESGTPIVSEQSSGEIILATLSSVSPRNRQRFEDATTEWEAKVPGLQFMEAVGPQHFIFVKNGIYNRSAVGYEGDGFQELEMNRWSNQGIIIHELGHALGLKHEQTRPDRDDYVEIIWENIDPDFSANYDISPTADAYPTGAFGVYDFASIMHYTACSFSLCESCSRTDSTCYTMKVIDPADASWQGAMGQRDSISFWDATVVNYMYPSSTTRFADAGNNSSGGALGSFVRPFSSFTQAMANTPAGAKLILLYPEAYNEPGVYTNPVVIESPLGNARIE